ncbi:MAG: DUF2341 domain-containing protein [Myxococcota bacterium]
MLGVLASGLACSFESGTAEGNASETLGSGGTSASGASTSTEGGASTTTDATATTVASSESTATEPTPSTTAMSDTSGSSSSSDTTSVDDTPSSSSSSSTGDPGWSFERVLTIDGPALGFTDPLEDVPVLLRLDDTRLDFVASDSEGADLRLYGAGGTALSFEIERWDAAAAEALVWVKVPLIAADAPTQLLMQYGNPSAVDAQDPEEVWTSNFVSVHHMLGSCAESLVDSTGNGHDGGCINLDDAALIDGQFGPAVLFDNTGDVQVADDTDFNLDAQFSFSVLVEVSEDTLATNDARRVLEKGEHFRLLAERAGGGGGIRATVWVNDGARNASGGPSPLGWHYLAGTAIAGDQVRLYLDGVLIDDTTLGDPIDLAAGTMVIGGTMVGAVDEARVAATARSDAWIAFQAQVFEDLAVGYGAETAL